MHGAELEVIAKVFPSSRSAHVGGGQMRGQMAGCWGRDIPVGERLPWWALEQPLERYVECGTVAYDVHCTASEV